MNAPNSEDIYSFFQTEFVVYKALMSFLNGSGARLNKICPQSFTYLPTKSSGNAELNYWKPLAKLPNIIG